MKDLVEMYNNEGFQVVLMELAKKAKCEFHRYRRFSKDHIDKNDGVHPATDHIQILAKEFHQALQRLSTDKFNGEHTSGASGT